MERQQSKVELLCTETRKQFENPLVPRLETEDKSVWVATQGWSLQLAGLEFRLKLLAVVQGLFHAVLHGSSRKS